MSRITIDLNDDAAALVMARYGLLTQQDAVNFALRALASEPMSLAEARGMHGSGWEGELDAMRESRTL